MYLFSPEPFLEAVPQIHVLLGLWVLEETITFGLSPKLFIATFSSSVLTATLGIAKFLKVGPCRLVPDEGILGGHGNLGFLLIMVNIATTILSKGFLLPAIAYDNELNSLVPLVNAKTGILIWMMVSYLPQMLYVSSFKYTFK